MRSLSYDPVSVWPRLRQSESTLALHSNQTSARFRVNIRIRSIKSLNKTGIFARRARVDQAIGLCYRSKLNILEDLTLEKSQYSVIAFLHDQKNLVIYVLTLDLIENAL